MKKIVRKKKDSLPRAARLITVGFGAAVSRAKPASTILSVFSIITKPSVSTGGAGAGRVGGATESVNFNGGVQRG